MAQRMLPGRYYGETLRSSKTASFELSERVYPPGFQTPKHTHNQALLCFVMKGNYTENYGSKTRECTASTLLFHPPEESHAQHFHEAGGHSFLVEIAPRWLAELGEYMPISDRSTDFHGGVFESLARKLYREFTHNDCASSIIIEGVMMEMLGEMLRGSLTQHTHAAPRWLQDAKEMLHAHFAENLSLSELGQKVGIHPVHLAQTFRKNFHCTIGEYIRTLRIDYACHELTSSGKPIVDIALAAGFCDQSHFTRTFKRAVGVAPSQYRESVRES